MLVTELEQRYQMREHSGTVKFLAFVNCGLMSAYRDAVQLAQQTGETPDTGLVRRLAFRPGVATKMEQEVTSDLGVFLRAILNNGTKEAYEFTEINRSVSGGVSLQDDWWGRPDNTVGLARVINGLSSDAR